MAGMTQTIEPAASQRAEAPPEYGNFIAGEWRPAESGRTFESRNPADSREVIATFAASADRLSVAAYGRVLAVEGVIDVNAPETAAPVAVIVLAVVTALAVRAAARRLTRTEMP